MQIALLAGASPKTSTSTGPRVRLRRGSWELYVEGLKDSVLDLKCVTPRTAPEIDTYQILDNITNGNALTFDHPTIVQIIWKIRGTEKSINVSARYL